MRTKYIEINGQPHQLSCGLRSLFLFEEISGKAFQQKTLSDAYLYYFCCFLAAEPDFMDGDFQAFINLFEEDNTLTAKIVNALSQLQNVEKALDGRTITSDDKKKD